MSNQIETACDKLDIIQGQNGKRQYDHFKHKFMEIQIRGLTSVTILDRKA